MNSTLNNSPFWMVWNERGDAPRVKHTTKESAQREATRLARLHRGHSFIVLESVQACISNDVLVVDMRPGGYRDGDMPF